MTEAIGVVGVGRMGSRMARNLLDAGYEVAVNDLDPDRIGPLVDAGATGADSLAEIAERSDVVMTSLPNTEAVEAVYFGSAGLLERLDDGAMVVELSTVEPHVLERIADEAGGIDVVDAPVIGPPAEAAAGTLTVIAGGAADALDRARPILEVLSNHVEPVDAVGDATRLKLANNVVLFGNYAVVSEMMALVDRMGIDRETFFSITSSGAGGAAIADLKLPTALEGDFEPGFTLDLTRKDLRYAHAMKEEADFAAPIAAVVAEQYTRSAALAGGDRDYSVLLETIADANGA